MRILTLLFFLTAASSAIAKAPPSNWGGPWSPCEHHPDLLSRSYVDIGVRFSTRNPILAAQFGRAMNFWRSVLDIDWHQVSSGGCSMQLVDGRRDLFDSSGIAARSQFPDRAQFQGWVAFNPASKLSPQDMYVISVHEIGHLLGLPHNPDSSSVMYFMNVSDSVNLDAADLSSLAEHHKLREGLLASAIKGGAGF